MTGSVIKFINYNPGPAIRGPPQKSKFGTKNAISDRLGSRISPEGIQISKIGKAVDQLQPRLYLREKLCELWATNKIVIAAHDDPPKIITACAV